MGIADSMKEITEDIITSYDVRVKAVGDLAADTRKTLKGIQKAHKEMADDLKESLGKGETDRLKSFKSMMGNIQKGIKDIESYVANKLKEFSDAHADMSEELKKDLAKYVSGIVSDTKKLLSEYSSDMKKAANAWQGMSKTLARARKGGAAAPKVEAKVKVRPVKEAVEEVEEKEVSPETELEEKVLKFIKKHPKGVKVGDMEEHLGVARTRLGVIAKRLLDEGRVRKEENLYFPL